jgi:hypothetical protein
MSSSLDYSSNDFDSLVIQLTDILKAKDLWKDSYQSSTGQGLIQLFAYLGDTLNYYIQRRAEESYLNNCKLRSSAVGLTSLIGYVPDRPISASGTVVFTLTASKNKDVLLPKFTQLTATNGYKYVLTESSVVLAGNTTSGSINCKQGEYKEETSTGTGEAYQSVVIQSIKVENTILEVYVNGVLWSSVTSFVSSINTDEHFVSSIDSNDFVRIDFGDGAFGKVPPNGSDILVKYVDSDGTNGDIFTTSGVVTTIDDTIYDTSSVVITDISVDNNSVFIGSADTETLASIKTNAPQVFSTGDRAVTNPDFIYLMEAYPGVAKAISWGEAEESPPNYTMFNQIKLVIVPDNKGTPTSILKDAVRTLLDTKKVITTKLTFVDPVYISVNITITAYTSDSNDSNQVNSDMNTALESYFTLANQSLEGHVRKSLVDSTIAAVTGVSYHTSIISAEDTIGTGDGSTVAFASTLNLLSVKSSTVTIYINGVSQGTDDGAGNLTGAGISSGTINYTTGVISVTFNTAPGSLESVTVDYQQDNVSNDLEFEKEYIAELGTATITVNYIT